MQTRLLASFVLYHTLNPSPNPNSNPNPDPNPLFHIPMKALPELGKPYPGRDPDFEPEDYA